MTQDIIEEYMVTDGNPVLVKKTVMEKEVPPDLAVLKVLDEFYNTPNVTEIDFKGELI